jgi:hypothetical protein
VAEAIAREPLFLFGPRDPGPFPGGPYYLFPSYHNMGKNGIKERQYFMQKNCILRAVLQYLDWQFSGVAHMKVLLLMLKMVF